VTRPYRIERLARHDRSAFTCGEPDLDRYFRTIVGQDERRGMARAFVAVTDSGTVAGFYTLAAGAIRHEQLPPDRAKRAPPYSMLPVVLLGRMAVAVEHQSAGLGFALLADAVRRVIDAEIGACAVVVDPKSERAGAFYRSHGFEPLGDGSSRLFLPVATGKAAI
jgi:GNAT superfamily N-acetyltransferase